MFLILNILCYILLDIVVADDWNFAGVNIALGKKTSQSPRTYDRYESYLAIDGNKDGNVHDGSCTHTTGPQNTKANWTVYLNGSYTLKGIRVFNRKDLRHRLKNFKIIGLPDSIVLHNDASSKPQLYKNARIDVAINTTKQVSSITIEIPAHTGWPDNGIPYLTLCEVQVFSEMEDCPAPSLDGYLVSTVRNGTGYLNTAKGLVSTGAVLDFRCNGYYTIKGSETITCVAGGVYNASVPTCTEIRCNEPPIFTHGHYVLSAKDSYAVGDLANWTCDQGYTSDQNRSRQCLASTHWSGDQPNCTRTTCSFPSQVSNGYFQFENKSKYGSGHTEIGIVINLVCTEGFKANLTNISCTEDGQWDTVPECVPVKCTGLGKLIGGYHIYMQNGTVKNNDEDVYEYGTTATAICNETLFKVSNENSKRRCEQDGIWSGNDHLCANGEAEAAQSTSNGAAVGGGVVAVIFILAAMATAMFIIRRRIAKRNGPETHFIEKEPQQPKYSKVTEIEANVYESPTDVEVPDHREPYYNITGVHKISQSVIKIDKLADLVMAPESANCRFQNEFQAFPEGMKKQHHHALQNKDRNKYRGLYAYDDTRVVLDIWNEETDTDYINACYIHGFEEPKSYIASQGPVKNSLDDFWRMVWQNKCGKIVMLTNLMEEGRMKCIQYWPESGSETYGSVVVTLENTDIFANFTIRTLTVTKGGERQRVLQFHFTSWPDKDVPLFCSSLVQFRNKVKATGTSSNGPMIVHCSAGVGRTGTFIAIDYLVDQAEKVGYVDIAGCVQALRRQRVNMVQTKKQYIFVHLALVEILVLKTSVVPTAKFEENYLELLSAEGAKRMRKMDVEFEILWKMTLVDESEIREATSQGCETKNRYPNILPLKEFMPSLSQPGRYLYGEYINAAFLPVYKEDNALIITQTPLQTTVEDFWKMVLHQGVHTIVMMNHVTELSTSEIYWPALGENQTYGEHMHIFNKQVAKQRGHRIVTLELTTKKEEREVKLIQFEKWGKGKPLPEAPDQILSALDLMEEIQRQTGNKPAIVHRMNGEEKSGLFCVLASLLDRAKVEQDIAISHVIQEMRNRRQNIIPNVEQFQFCHDVVLAFLRQFDTYSNFSLKR